MHVITGHIGTEQYLTDLTTDSGHALLADEPLSNGGQNMGMAPGELLAASLSSCICITLRMYADRLGWPLAGAQAQVSFEHNEKQQITHLDCVVQLQGELTFEQRQRLLHVAHACPIHKVLLNAVPLTTRLA